jgi:hypothetical protein
MVGMLDGIFVLSAKEKASPSESGGPTAGTAGCVSWDVCNVRDA